MKFFEHLRKQGQSGQSLVILALGFLALLGFVGIVTDVSVLFIRYSTLSRAVDAAAIAAAGQMRRVADPTPGHDEAISVANLNLAARQFIEVYGLNPKSVVVETCRAQEVGRDSNGNPIDENNHPLFLSDGSVNPAADQTVVKSYQQLCTTDELKLVRVTAQIDAPTIFLRLLGYPTVTLTDSAISQTAVLDVVLIFDVSDAMVNETTYADWDNIPNTPPGYNSKQGVIYMPPFVGPGDVDGEKSYEADQPLGAWQYMGAQTESFLNTLITPDSSFTATADPEISDRTIAFEPNASAASGYQLFTGSTSTASDQGRVAPREFCQVRAYQGSAVGNSFPNQTLRQQYVTFFDWLSTSGGHPTETYQNQFIGHGKWDPSLDYHVADNASDTGATFYGFVPMYNSFACCNDPLGIVDNTTGDFTFDQLVCQPFKDARDAAHQFLDRLDFLRGDRVAFVTFDRRAQVIDPDGTNGPQASMIETQKDLADPSNPSQLLRKGADETLDDSVGVRAEYTGYADTNGDGLWDHLMNGGSPVTYNDLMNNINVGDLEDTPVQYECPLLNAGMPMYYLPTNYSNLPGGGLRGGSTLSAETLLDGINTVPSWYFTTGNGDTNPNHDGSASNGTNFTDPGFHSVLRSYEFRASCGRGNVGAGLEAGSGTLYNEGRREGAVWVMVMLSDGAAGASNPITSYQSQNLRAADPYFKNGNAYDPAPGVNGPSTSPQNAGAAGYGAFGLCPYGTAPNTVGSNGTTTGPSQIFNWTDFAPFCEDLKPETRHFCGLTQQVQPDATLDLDTNCFNFYNTDDYARDWADWVGLANLPLANTTNATSGRVSNQLLPTIFTIGFGFNFDEDDSGNHASDCAPLSGDSLYNCMRGINQTEPSGLSPSQLRLWARGMQTRDLDYLGEELMRYVADVGDNNQLDSDWWQLCESKNAAPYGSGSQQSCRDDGVTNTNDRIGNAIDLTSSSPDWGPRGACEATWTDTANPNNRGSAYMPLPPQQSCGNYYVAATGQQLEQVFDQIASRMFTRLSQ